MQYLQLLRHWIGALWVAFQGPVKVREVTAPRMQIESLVGYSISGYVTTIHCQERQFLCEYERWFIRDRLTCTYNVFATVSGIAPQAIVDACSLEKSFPRLLHPWLPSGQQKEAAIGAYLDILIARLQHPS